MGVKRRALHTHHFTDIIQMKLGHPIAGLIFFLRLFVNLINLS